MAIGVPQTRSRRELRPSGEDAYLSLQTGTLDSRLDPARYRHERPFIGHEPDVHAPTARRRVLLGLSAPNECAKDLSLGDSPGGVTSRSSQAHGVVGPPLRGSLCDRGRRA